MEKLRIKAFHRCVDDFLTDLVRTFPSDYTFGIVQTMIKTFRTSIPEKDTIRYFWEYVKDYRQEISNHDESFFMADEIIQTVPQGYSSLFHELRSVWTRPTTTDQTKTAIFQHVVQLVKIAEMVCAS